MGELMAQAIDHAGIQFRTLNASRALRYVQLVHKLTAHFYKAFVRNVLENTPNLTLFQPRLMT